MLLLATVLLLLSLCASAEDDVGAATSNEWIAAFEEVLSTTELPARRDWGARRCVERVLDDVRDRLYREDYNHARALVEGTPQVERPVPPAAPPGWSWLGHEIASFEHQIQSCGRGDWGGRLQDAAALGRTARVRRLAKPSQFGGLGDPVEAAREAGHVRTVRVLLRAGYNPQWVQVTRDDQLDEAHVLIRAGQRRVRTPCRTRWSPANGSWRTRCSKPGLRSPRPPPSSVAEDANRTCSGSTTTA